MTLDNLLLPRSWSVFLSYKTSWAPWFYPSHTFDLWKLKTFKRPGYLPMSLSMFSLGTVQNLLYDMAGGEENSSIKTCLPRIQLLQENQLPR